MTLDEAIECLTDTREPRSMLDLAEAIANICDDSRSTFDQIMLGLRFPGTVRECAAIELHRRTGRPLPSPQALVLSEADWRRWLAQSEIASARSASTSQR